MKFRFFVLFCFGALLGSLLDSMHVHGGTAFYANPMEMGISWWTPLIMGVAAMAIGYSHFKIHPNVPNLKPVLLLSMFCFIISYALSAFLPVSNSAKTLIISLLYLIGWGLYDRTFLSLILAMSTAIIGSAVEGSLGATGFFVYTHPDYFLVPLWLLPLYANASSACGNLGRYLFKS